uniref:Uncharacterized protein n=1 Tax=Hucho hucho TaxID=62062 RepID=A0A4W5MTG9_9TELE
METKKGKIVSQFKTFFSGLVASQLPAFVKVNATQARSSSSWVRWMKTNDRELTFLEFWQLIGKLSNKQGGF